VDDGVDAVECGVEPLRVAEQGPVDGDACICTSWPSLARERQIPPATAAEPVSGS
jgi:hypothetical protein